MSKINRKSLISNFKDTINYNSKRYLDENRAAAITLLDSLVGEPLSIQKVFQEFDYFKNVSEKDVNYIVNVAYQIGSDNKAITIKEAYYRYSMNKLEEQFKEAVYNGYAKEFCDQIDDKYLLRLSYKIYKTKDKTSILNNGHMVNNSIFFEAINKIIDSKNIIETKNKTRVR